MPTAPWPKITNPFCEKFPASRTLASLRYRYTDYLGPLAQNHNGDAAKRARSNALAAIDKSQSLGSSRYKPDLEPRAGAVSQSDRESEEEDQ